MSGNNPYRKAMTDTEHIAYRQAYGDDPKTIETRPEIVFEPGTLDRDYLRQSIVNEIRQCCVTASINFQDRQFLSGYNCGIDAAIEIVVTRLKR